MHQIIVTCGLLAWSLLPVAVLSPVAPAAEKLKPQEVVEKHLASLGSPENRAAIRTRVLEGRARLDILIGGGTPLAGRALVVSDGRKYRVALEFLRQNYWGEQYMTDGDKVEVGFIIPGRRSQLGNFLNTYREVVQEGLPGGVLSTAWPLLDMQAHQPKLEYDGLKKVGDRQLHRLTYKLRKGGGLVTILLFFEQDTFRHVRTFIQHTEPAPLPATAAQPVAQSETRYTLEEDFSEFKEVDGLTLPTVWTIRMTAEISGGNSLLRWTVQFEKLSHNVTIQPAELAIEPPGKVVSP